MFIITPPYQSASAPVLDRLSCSCPFQLWYKLYSGAPAARRAAKRSIHNYRKRTTCMHRNRNPCNSFFMVNMASGMDHGRVGPTTTTNDVTQHGKSCSLGLYKLIAILRRQYHIIMTASWEKIYSVLGGVAKRRRPIRNIFSSNAVNIMWYCRLKIAISFVSRSIIYKDK